MQIKGNLCAVTGAASGLGRATAKALHDAGAAVLLLDLNKDRLEELQAELAPGTTLAVAVDVRDPGDIERSFDDAIAMFGPLRAVVNCAGIASSAKIVSRGEPHDFDLWRRVIDINLNGSFNVMRLAAARMVKNEPIGEAGERGVIVNTASVAAEDGQKGQAAYAASKAGIAALSLPVARDLAEHAIRCVAVAPGLFGTELFDHIPEKGIEALKRALLYPARMGLPSEFAGLVRHIVENPYLNGSLIRLDGGARLPA
ncbi:short-chain dehydrogenase/reductase SDR (plasmid) [Rhizobium leguminosarum bv. trifolii WSM2304]|uniref:Short-chain dehydrogenase/reductase SDR n=1 Tax=Rhizobium leguminosarum bv. trifolii (strain WSM2304) TaxID=395492 RepID=A0ABF7QYV8_RHILW|nr:SDR family NAD(P)-dependent oxidoreductase [Rhizobium leguminosarum]ACI59514.1 short-chain dehydrogenase/reductase SDR [Rhizobium leguminosarum bv. trifolii WSM2304]